jgi:thiol-disulfide isomerase/thioredoxin
MQTIIIITKYTMISLILLHSIGCSKKTTHILIKADDAPIIKPDTLVIEIKPEPIKIKELKYAFNFEENSTLSGIFDKAAIENKLVFVDVHAEWCAPCKLMQRDVYTHESTATYFNNNFVNTMVDIDTLEGPDIKLIFDINVIPTLLWLDSKGRVVHRKEGACYHGDLIKNAEMALQKHKN